MGTSPLRIVGDVVGDSPSDTFAGLFEGKVAEYLRAHHIYEAMTPLSSSMGKMSGSASSDKGAMVRASGFPGCLSLTWEPV